MKAQMKAILTDHRHGRTHVLISDDREAGRKALGKIVKQARPTDMTKQEWEHELERGWDVQLIVEMEEQPTSATQT